MAVEGKQWVVWFSNPKDPGWDFWCTSRTKKVAKKDARVAKERCGYQTFIQGPAVFPKLKPAKSTTN